MDAYFIKHGNKMPSIHIDRYSATARYNWNIYVVAIDLTCRHFSYLPLFNFVSVGTIKNV